MEARLIHAHKVRTINSDTRVWRIINPLKFGIRVDELMFFNDNITPDVSHFLTDIAGEGGPWDGWTLYAVGNLIYTAELIDPTPYFQVVFVRKEKTAEERAGEGFEMVDAMKELKNEDFPVVQGEYTPAAHGVES
ncbi:MAG: hypothetical protein Q9175_001727 [Cornicularia normoerica]